MGCSRFSENHLLYLLNWSGLNINALRLLLCSNPSVLPSSLQVKSQVLTWTTRNCVIWHRVLASPPPAPPSLTQLQPHRTLAFSWTYHAWSSLGIFSTAWNTLPLDTPWLNPHFMRYPIKEVFPYYIFWNSTPQFSSFICFNFLHLLPPPLRVRNLFCLLMHHYCLEQLLANFKHSINNWLGKWINKWFFQLHVTEIQFRFT